MKKDKHQRTTVTIRLTEEEYEVLGRVCALKKTSRTAYLAQLATHHAKQELLRYAAKAYLDGHVSLSALATETGLDVPTIMDEVSRLSGEDSHTRDDFLAAVKTLSHVNHDPDFYRLAVKALTDSSESKV
jgi:uncharacterized protein (DUF1778 family)